MSITKWNYKLVKKYVEENSSAKLVSTTYKRQKDKLKFICSCGSPFETNMDAFIRSNVRQCKKCGYKNGATKNALSQEDFLKRAKVVFGDDFEIVECDYKNQNSIIQIRHKICKETFPRKASKIMNGKGICGVCGSNIKRDITDVQKEINSFSSEIKVLEYVNSNHIILEHITCGEKVIRSMSELRKHKGFNCPKCKSSYGSRKITQYLIDKNIYFKKEFIFNDCKLKKPLPFDFYIPEYNVLIEYDGEHHDRPLKHWGGQKKFELVKKRDEIKTNYCLKNNIPLLRISSKDNEEIDNILEKFFNMIIPR